METADAANWRAPRNTAPGGECYGAIVFLPRLDVAGRESTALVLVPRTDALLLCARERARCWPSRTLALRTNTERVRYTGIEVVDDCFVEQSGSP